MAGSEPSFFDLLSFSLFLVSFLCLDPRGSFLFILTCVLSVQVEVIPRNAGVIASKTL